MSTQREALRADTEQGRDRADAAEQKFVIPVIVAALASVPATFLTMLEGPLETAGRVVNYTSLAVLTAESLILFVLAGDRVGWLKRRWWLVAIALASIPAVIFAVGPVQALRLLRFVGALRIVRVGRIIRAGRILRERLGLTGPLRTTVVAAVTFACAAFVALVLADPTTETRRLFDRTVEEFGPWAIIAAGLILAAATFIVWRARGQRADSRGE